jgi:hypothetical protein
LQVWEACSHSPSALRSPLLLYPFPFMVSAYMHVQVILLVVVTMNRGINLILIIRACVRVWEHLSTKSAERACLLQKKRRYKSKIAELPHRLLPLISVIIFSCMMSSLPIFINNIQNVTHKLSMNFLSIAIKHGTSRKGVMPMPWATATNCVIVGIKNCCMPCQTRWMCLSYW